jgi:hypothetical protein
MANALTVGELRKLIADLPDDMTTDMLCDHCEAFQSIFRAEVEPVTNYGIRSEETVLVFH